MLLGYKGRLRRTGDLIVHEIIAYYYMLLDNGLTELTKKERSDIAKAGLEWFEKLDLNNPKHANRYKELELEKIKEYFEKNK